MSCRQIHEFNKPATTWLKNKITSSATALNAATGGYGTGGVLGISIGGIQQAVKANLVEPLCNSTDGSISSLTKYDEELQKCKLICGPNTNSRRYSKNKYFYQLVFRKPMPKQSNRLLQLTTLPMATFNTSDK